VGGVSREVRENSIIKWTHQSSSQTIEKYGASIAAAKNRDFVPNRRPNGKVTVGLVLCPFFIFGTNTSERDEVSRWPP